MADKILPKAGEVWDIDHQRKGAFTALFEEDMTDPGEWVRLMVVEGKARFVSIENRMMGAGTPGDSFGVRISFIRLIRRREELERDLVTNDVG